MRLIARVLTVGLGVVAVSWSLPGSTSPRLAAQESEDTASAERPFVAGGVYDKPYLTTLAGRTALGGYGEAHLRAEWVDGAREELGFEARRFNLFTSTRVSDFVRVGAELEIEEGGEEITLEYAAIDVALHPALTLRGGMILSPLGRFNLAHDSPQNEFTDRPLVSIDLLGVALSEPGLGFFGLVPLPGHARLTYELYAVNGFHAGVIDDSPDGLRIPRGKGNVEDENASPAFVGRLALSPREGWEVGLSAHHGAWNVFDREGLEVDERRNLTIGVLDLEASPFGLRVEGEAALASIDLPPGLKGFLADSQSGFYLQAMYDFGRGWIGTMPASFFSAGVRLEAVDFDTVLEGDAVEQASIGLNFRPTRDTVLKLNWVRGNSFDGFDNESDHAGVLFSIATYF